MRAFALLTVTVLAVIAIGVALVNGLPNPSPVLRTYGSPPLRFEAAFPNQGVPLRTLTPWQGFRVVGTCTRSASFVVTGVDLAAIGGGPGERGYCPELPVGIKQRVGPPSRSPSDNVAPANGVRCGYPLRILGRVMRACVGSMFIREDGLVWVANAYAPTRQVVQQFLKSFKPLSASP